MRRGYRDTNVLKAIELLLSRGFDISIDLLYGLPGQQIPSLVKDMETAATTGVQQISAYPLMPFPHTGWYKDIKSGKIPVPSAGTEKKMFYAVSDSLTSSGYRQASCWDFVSADEDIERYVTCTRDENIGVGLSAYTKIGGLFYVNTFSLKDYVKSVVERLPIATGMTMPPERVMRRWFMMGLYGLRIEKAEFERRFGVKIDRGIGSLLPMLKLMNIVKEHPEYIEVTRNGMYWASLMTKTSMLTFPGRYYEECLRSPWPDEFEM
jgi:oxygen-independent coproporphyrinogen-3 oxidase